MQQNNELVAAIARGVIAALVEAGVSQQDAIAITKRGIQLSQQTTRSSPSSSRSTANSDNETDGGGGMFINWGLVFLFILAGLCILAAITAGA